MTDTFQMTLGGHLNYYSHRQFAAPDGNSAVVSELLEFPLPFVVDLYEAAVEDVEFSFPEDEPAAELAPLQPLGVPPCSMGRRRSPTRWRAADATTWPPSRTELRGRPPPE